MYELEKEIRSLLKGIDKEELEDYEGWWSTSKGAEFGKEKLEELIRLVSIHVNLID